MKKTIVFTFITAFFVNSAVFPVKPQTLPADSDSDKFTGKVDKLFAQWDHPDSPGCALGVIKNEKLIYKRGYGMADVEHGTPITSESGFDSMSMTKQFTAASIMLLVQRGKISLDDDVRKYVPEVPDFGTPITIRHLVYHTSGLREEFNMWELAGWRWDDIVTESDVFDLLSRTKELNYKPGDEHSYTNTGYSLMAIIVKRVSGQSLREFADQNIFKPLGMNQTVFHDDHRMIIKNRAASYHKLKDGGFEIGPSTLDLPAVFTSVEDLARWDQNFYDKKVGGEEGIRQLVTPGKLNNGQVLNYGFGLRITKYRGLNAVWHSGAGQGFKTAFMRFPDQHFSVICLCNLDSIDMDELTEQVADIYLADKFTEGPRGPVKLTEEQQKKVAELAQFAKEHFVQIPETELSAFTGLYSQPGALFARHVSVKNGKLMVERAPGIESELSPTGGNQFLLMDVPAHIEVSFKAGESNSAMQMTSVVDNGKPLIVTRAGAAATTPEQLSAYTGNYYSEELGSAFTLVLKEGKLMLQRRKWADVELSALYEDVFRNDSNRIGTLFFARNSAKEVTAFSLTNSDRSIRHLKFTRIN